MNSINHLDLFRNKIRQGRICIGMAISMTDPMVCEMAGDLGFDFTWIDMEHNALSNETVAMHLMAQRGTGCAPFVRVPWNEHGIIKPILDMAPAGVIIPMVCSAEAAEQAVSACRYPLRGTRGCGIRRGMCYGQIPLDEYMKNAETDPLVIVQIEHVDAVRELDRILKVPGIDSICIGASDMASSMGVLGQPKHPELVRMIEEVCTKTKKAGLMLGAAGYPFELWQSRGVDWVALTSDWSCLMSEAKRILAEVADGQKQVLE